MSRIRRAVKAPARGHPLAGRAVEAMRGLPMRPGLIGQGARYAIAGAVMTVFYIALTTFLALAVGLPFQVALAIGFCFSLAMHFTLQRRFVWADHEQFALPFHHQAGRYVIASVAQYGMTAASTSLLPRVLGVSPEVVYLVTVPVLALSNFLVFRYVVFHDAKVLAGPPV